MELAPARPQTLARMPQLVPTQPFLPINQELPIHPIWGDHPLAYHPVWNTYPELLSILVLSDPWAAARAIQVPAEDHPDFPRLNRMKQNAYNMLASRDQRESDLFCTKPEGKRNSPWTNIEWDVLRKALPRLVVGEKKFGNVNWRAIDVHDKLRFWNEADRACKKREESMAELALQLQASERQVEEKDEELVHKTWQLTQKDEEIEKLREQLAHQALELESIRAQHVSPSVPSGSSATFLGTPLSPSPALSLSEHDRGILIDVWVECRRRKLVPPSVFCPAEEFRADNWEYVLAQAWLETKAVYDFDPIAIPRLCDELEARREAYREASSNRTA